MSLAVTFLGSLYKMKQLAKNILVLKIDLEVFLYYTVPFYRTFSNLKMSATDKRKDYHKIVFLSRRS
jgi:hypothetical protein